jgi:uncharacterized protein
MTDLLPLLTRIADALDRLAPPAINRTVPTEPALVWEGRSQVLTPVSAVARIDWDLLLGVEPQKASLLANTRQFADGHSANNVLLWGARGMGKSSLVKAVHALVAGLTLVEIHREDIASLPELMRVLRAASPRRFILFCDDLSFEAGDVSYKALKAALEGGLEGRPDTCLFYATSNRRHLVPRDLIENEQGTSIHPRDVVEDKVSLSDRFGLWLGFHACSQDEYLAMVEAYAKRFDVRHPNLRAAALEWSATRGARSGRVAWQFIQDAAGRAWGSN